MFANYNKNTPLQNGTNHSQLPTYRGVFVILLRGKKDKDDRYIRIHDGEATIWCKSSDNAAQYDTYDMAKTVSDITGGIPKLYSTNRAPAQPQLPVSPLSKTEHITIHQDPPSVLTALNMEAPIYHNPIALRAWNPDVPASLRDYVIFQPIICEADDPGEIPEEYN